MVCIFLASPTVFADKTKQAMKYLERGELNKVEETILKSLEKEPLNPAANYLFAVLYSMDEYPKYNIDTAKLYILQAITEFEQVDEKTAEEILEAGINTADFEQRKKLIEALIFNRSVSLNSIAGFNNFMKENPEALQVKKALKKRDSLAYLIVKKENTWKAYDSFMKAYPEAVDYPKAKRNYDHLIFQSKTNSGKLDDLQIFLAEHPKSPYYESILQEVFSIVAADGNRSIILNFLKDNPNPSIIRKGINILYHFNKQNRADIFKIKGNEALLDSIKETTSLDAEVLFPVLEDEKYLFINFSGDQIINGQFDEISKDYYCGNIISDVLEVTQNGTHKIINRKNVTIYDKSFSSAEDIGIGVLKLKTGEKYRAIHKSGFEISEEAYEDISIVGKRLIKVTQESKAGLLSITGKTLCPIEYDDIYSINDYWIFEKNGRIGLMAFENIMKGADGLPIDPILKYDEAELIDDEYLICFTEDKEVLFNPELRRVVPEGEQRINTRFDTWTVKQPLGYRVFNRTKGELITTLYDDLYQNEEWLALKKNNKWSVYRKSLEDVPIIGLDSVKLIGDNIAMVFRGVSGTAIFPNKTTVEFKTGDLLYSINNASQTDSHFLVINKEGENTLYQDGKILFTVDYEEIGYLSDSAFYVREEDKYGAVNIQGNLVMRVRYDAITTGQNSISNVLFEGKFGAYNFKDKILIKYDFDQKLRHYNEQLLITKLDGKAGLLNIYNEDVILPQFDKIEYWSDSIALTKTDKLWAFTEIYTGEQVFGDILDYRVLDKNEAQTTLRIRTNLGYGIYNTTNGLIVEPTFSDIININTLENPLYFCEKSIPEGKYYIAIYKDKTGKTIRSQAYRAEEYDRIVCE